MLTTQSNLGVSTEEEVRVFQESLGKIFNWQQENNMVFNNEKFQVLRLGPNQHLKNCTSLFTYNFQELIHPEEIVKDLGVLMDMGYTFKTRRENIVSMSKNKASCVLQTFKARDPYFMKTLLNP